MSDLGKAARAIYNNRASFAEDCWVDGREFLDLTSVKVDGNVNLIEVARAVIQSIIDNTGSPYTVDELTRTLREAP